ncbi:hypothetical protein [Flavobacterium sp.]|uniref:hypothetical protein n=1 Tax=Flavobacterium sp. TaxID=239 RepID=UPI0033402673
MKKTTILIVIFGIILIPILYFKYLNIKENIIKSSKLNKQQIFQKGEWISNLDSSSGISIRENKIAFFKKMKFTSDDIYEYKILDSIYQTKDEEDKVKEFLMMKDFSNTIYYQIIKKNDSSITLKINKTKIETFNLKKSEPN